MTNKEQEQNRLKDERAAVQSEYQENEKLRRIFWEDTPEAKAYTNKIREYQDRTFKYEAHLEEYFAREVKKAGGLSIKFNSVGTNGLPDRIVFFEGSALLVELKMPKGVVQPHQVTVHNMLARYGFKVWIVRNKEQIAEFISHMKNNIL